MRIGSTSFYAASLSGILDQQSNIAKLSQQIATEKRLTRAADDPVATTQSMSLGNQITQSSKYLSNIATLSTAQSEEATVLEQIRKDIVSAQSMLKGLGGGTSDADIRNSTAATIAGLYADIKSLANYKDSSGNYIFAGFQSKTAPYDHTQVYGNGTTSASTTFQGDSGQRMIQIGQGQNVAANDSLESIMQSGTSSDLLQNLDQVAADLQNNASGLQTSLDSTTQILDSALSGLKSIQAGLAARQSQVSNQKDMVNQLLTGNQNALTTLTAVDQASAIVELQTRQTSLQAAESAFSQISKLSVFNYL